MKYSIDDETGHSCDVNLDVSAVFFNSSDQQRDVLPRPEKEGFSGRGQRRQRWYFGKAEDADQSVPRVACRGDEGCGKWKSSGYNGNWFESAGRRFWYASVADIGVNEHLTKSPDEVVNQAGVAQKPGERSSVSCRIERSHLENQAQQTWFRFEGKTRPTEVRKRKDGGVRERGQREDWVEETQRCT